MKEWKRKSWTSSKSKRAREAPSEVEETPWNGEEYAETKIQNKKVERRVLGKIFPCLENTNCSVCKARRRMKEQQRMMNDYERSDKENQVKSKDGR